MWLCPLTDSKSGKFFVKGIQYQLEFRAEDICVFSHVGVKSVKILEESYVAELVQLIMADGLNLHISAEIIQVCLGSCYSCDTGAREAYLGSGCEFINKIRVASLRTLTKNLNQEILIIIIEMMDAVGIIPVNTEVRCCRFQSCKTLYGFFRVGVALWVGVFRNTPDSLDGCILTYQLLYHVHIRSLWSHRNIDHLDSEKFGDLEVTVITRYRTEEFHLVKLAPWSISHYTLSHGTCNTVEHNVQA